MSASRRRKSHRSLVRAARSVVEHLEDRRLLAAAPLVYANAVQPLPYALDFTKQVPGVLDSAGQATGFTRVQANINGDEYQPAQINLNTAAGQLNLTTIGTDTTGSAYGTNNTLDNALETQFDATTRGFSITARIKGPLSQLSANYDTGTLYFGPDDDNYVKLAAEYDSAHGQVLQFTDEQGATTHTVNSYASIGSFANLSTLDLRLMGDAGTGQITASYSVNGAAFVAMPGTVALSGTEEASFFSAVGRAGIYAASRNSLPPITVPFSHFEIDPGTPISTLAQPSVHVVHPGDGQTNISRDSFISVDFNLPNGAIDPSTLFTANPPAALYRTSDHTLIPSKVNTTGGNDAIIVQPKVLLDPNTSYTFTLTSALQDVTGTPFMPYSETFTTGTAGGTTDSTMAFEKVSLPNVPSAMYTCVRIGPDHDLWASSQDGRIFQFPINADGTLGVPQIFNTLATFEGSQRLVTGFAFDPSSTAANPILWVTNGVYSGPSAYYTDNAPDFSDKITVMSGPGLTNIWDAVTDLPRSIRDHLTEQPVFGPDGALYFAQGANSSYGAPDVVWGNRPEHLLTAAILRLEVSQVSPGHPLDALTTDAGGTYNPFPTPAIPNPPLTIYASGVRNAFDLLWTKDGTLYAPSNGSSVGGNTPAFPNDVSGTRIDQDANGTYTGPSVPGISNVAEAEDDFLFNVQKGGYYGHPDPARDEYVLNGGRPTAALTDPSQVPDYPAGVLPDRNYRGYALDFGQHRSPDGIIEYQGTAFNGALNGKMLVAEYSGGSDIAILTRDANGNISSIERGVAGLTGFVNPINLAEDTTTGFLYVAQFGGSLLTLVRPIPPGAVISANKPLFVFNGAATGYSGAGASPVQTLTITNNGNVPLTFPSDGFTILPDPTASSNGATAFAIPNRLSLPSIVQPGQSIQVQLDYSASAVGPQSAILQIKSNDPNQPVSLISLHGIGTAGLYGYTEPSLVQVLRANNIPTIVGAGPNDINASTSQYPATPDPSSQEQLMPRLQKAGPGPVTITPLASFDASNQPVLRFGYYTPGDPADRTELFTIGQPDAQTVNPTILGASSFDPGSAAFGLYAIFPAVTTSDGNPDTHYSEDALNTLATNSTRKFRFFPLENPDKTIVANAYIVAAEDYNNSQYNSFVNFVGIIRNVEPAADAVGAPVIGLVNLDGAPFTDRLIFNRIQVLNSDSVVQGDVVHDAGTLQILNTGDKPLTINSLTLSDNVNWQVISAPTSPIAPGGTANVTIKFIAQSSPQQSLNQTNDYGTQENQSPQQAGGVWNGTLTINSNDPVDPNRTVQLAGYWQHHSEYEEEPGLQTQINLIDGYQTNISNDQRPQFPNNGKIPTYYGEEVNSAYWNVADPTLPVSVRQLDAFHSQEFNSFLTTAQVGWYPQGNSNTTHWLYSHQPRESQSLLPTITGSYATPAFGTFAPSGVFGWNLDGERSDDALNTADINTYGRSGHGVRFYPARDRQGNLIANEWIVAMDYQGGAFDNSDFQDNIYLVSNMRPAVQPPAPTDLFAVAPVAGGISMQWAPVPYAGATYNIYRASSISGPYTRINSSAITQPDYVDALAPTGVTSYYRITAVDPATNIESEAANAAATAAGMPAGAPAAPASLAATASAGGIALQWTANSEPNLAGYNVFRAASASGPFTQLNASLLTAPSYNDTGAPSGMISYYEVVAVNSSSVASGPAVISATRPAPAPVAPSAPGNLTLSANSPSQVILNWAASTGAVTAYHVERSTDGINFTEIAAAVPAGSLGYSDNYAQPSTTYTYRVRAENVGLFSGYSNAAPVTTPALATAPAVPANLTATASAGGILLSWIANTESNLTGYNVFRATSAGGPFTPLNGALLTTPSFNDTAAPAGATSYYQVVAVNTANLSSSPAAASATRPAAAPGASASFLRSDLTTGGSWSGVYGADGYGILGGTTAYPSYAQVGAANQAAYVWNPSTTDVRALQAGPSATSRIASCFYSSGAFTLDVNLTDGQPHQVALYMLDWDTTGRAQTVQVSDATSGTLLDTRAVSNFHNGQYLIWNLTGHVKITLTRTSGLNAVADGLFFGTGATTQPVAPSAPGSLIATPTAPTQVALSWSGSTGTVTAYHLERSTDGINFTEIAGNIPSSSRSYTDTTARASTTYTYRVRAENAGLFSGYSNVQQVTTPAAAAASAASFLLTDTTTQGSWNGVYGADGYGILDGPTGYPSYAQVAASGQLAFVWAPPTTDPRATQTGPGTSSRIASCFYSSGSFSLDINLTDGQSHQVALYMLDWDSTARAQTVQVSDAASGTILDTRTVASFHNGQYLVWNLTGHVKITFTRTAGMNAVASALLFGAAGVLPAAPSAPANLAATANSSTQVSLTWSASTGTVTAYHVERSTDGVNFTEIAGKVTGPSFVDTSAQPNTTYTYRVRAENSGQFSGYSNLAQATPPQAAPILTSLDINASQPGSTTVINNGTDYDLVAGGPAIYGSSDGFRYLYKQQTGDFDVKVRLNSLSADGQIAQAGLMARQSLDPSSANVFISASPDAGYRFKYRSIFGGQTGNATTGTVAYPNVWVRLKRAGSMFTGYTSTDGITWTLIGWTTVSMSDPIYLGMAAAANATSGTTTAQFRGFSAV